MSRASQRKLWPFQAQKSRVFLQEVSHVTDESLANSPGVSVSACSIESVLLNDPSRHLIKADVPFVI
jgi:hypothetical protein